MSKELKVRITDVEKIQKLILQKGGEYIGETPFVDTYFNQPAGKVLKIVRKNTGYFINIFHAVDGKFETIKDQQTDQADQLIKEYTSKYGVKRVLKGKRIYYKLKNQHITFNLIDNIGNFLIITSPNPTNAFVEKELEIKDPDYLRVSFDEVQ